MKKQRILRLCHKYLSDDDGYDLDIQDLSLSLKNNFENYVMFFIDKKALNDYIIRNKLYKKDAFLYHEKSNSFLIPLFYEKKHDDFTKDFFNYGNIKSFYSQFKSHLKKIDPHIVNIHGTLAIQFLLAAVISKKSRKKVISSHHIGIISHSCYFQNITLLLLKFVIHNLFPIISDKVICVSNHGKKSFLIKKNVLVINPIPPFNQQIKKIPLDKMLRNKALKNSFCINKNDIIYCCPARFSEQKNQLRLAMAFETILKENPNFKLVMIGNPYDSFYYSSVIDYINKSKFKNNFCILGKMRNRDIHNIMHNIDFVAMPSINEGFGRIAVEAIQHNIPILASKNTGFEDFVIHGRNGVLVDPYNLTSISNGLLEIHNVKLKKNISNHSDYIKKMKEVYNIM